VNEKTNVVMEETLDPTDWESTRALGHRILDDALDYVQALRGRPVWQHAPPDVKAHFEGPPVVDPKPSAAVYQEYVDYILPHQLGNNHPRFWGWVGGC
jgi:aromatic-L-amino-acid decarboxylase